MITKGRRESFGGILFSENPGFVAFVSEEYADQLGIPRTENLPSKIYSAPLDVHLSVTTRCNLHCPGCYATGDGVPEEDMDFARATGIIDNLSNLNVFTIALGGGEPFLYPHLFELARYIRERRIVPNVTTNGTLIDAEIAAQCHVFGTVHLSVHRLDELTRLEAAVRHLRRRMILPGINLLLTSETVNRLEELYAWTAKQGIMKILFLRFKITPRNRECQHMQLTPEQERELFPRLKRLSRRYHIVPMIDCSLFPALALHRVPKDHLRYQDVNGCQGGNAFIAVDVYGNYRPCSFWLESFGPADTLTAAQWVHGEELNRFRRWGPEPKCRFCDYLELCNQGCRLDRTRICFSEERAQKPPRDSF